MRTPLLFAVAFLAGSSVAAAADLSVGFGETDVTPVLGKQPVYMAGFGQNRLATKIHDPIMVRAVVLDDGTSKIAFVSADVVGLFITSVERIRSQLPGYKYVLVSATHNHEGPDTLGLWGPNPIKSGVDPLYLKRVEDGCVTAVKAADANRKPAVARIGTAAAPELIHDSRQPILKHDELVVLDFRDPKSDARLGILVQWNCHPEILDSKNTEVTADFLYYTVRYVRDTFKCPVAYFTGTVGGLMTNLHVPLKDAAGNELKDGTFEKSELYGTLVGKVAESAVGKSVPITLTPFDIRTRAILVPVENNLYRIAGQLGTLQRPMFEWTGNPMPKEFAPAKDLAKPIAVRTEVGYLKLGELEIAVIPGEIYPELVLGKYQDPVDPGADFPDAQLEPGIYTQMKTKHRMLFGLGNDEIGYIIPKRQWDEKPPFCYGLKKSQYGEINSVGPDTAGIICGTFKELVNGK